MVNIPVRPEEWVLWEENRLLQVQFDQRVSDLNKFCTLEQKKRSGKIVATALVVIAISLTVFCLFATSSIPAVLCSIGVFLVSRCILRQITPFPMDPYTEVNNVLRNNGILRYFDYDFFRFADDRGLLTDGSILIAYQHYKEHKALLVRIARAGLQRE